LAPHGEYDGLSPTPRPTPRRSSFAATPGLHSPLDRCSLSASPRPRSHVACVRWRHMANTMDRKHSPAGLLSTFTLLFLAHRPCVFTLAMASIPSLRARRLGRFTCFRKHLRVTNDLIVNFLMASAPCRLITLKHYCTTVVNSPIMRIHLQQQLLQQRVDA